MAKTPDQNDPPDTPDQFEEPMFLVDGVENPFDTHRPYGRSETGFLAGRSFRPSANVYETPDGLVISIDVPGISRTDIDISLEGRNLSVTGVRNFTRCDSNEELIRIERGFGSFRRTFEVPDGVDDSAITAKLESGVLTINVPRKSTRREIRVELED